MKVFVSYSHKDSEAMKLLMAGMNFYIKSKKIQAWTDHDIKAGDVFPDEIRDKMVDADYIILLISYNFLGSDYIMEKEISIAIEKFKNRTCTVIPIILDECNYDFLTDAFGAELELLPKTESKQLKPVNAWEKEAWNVITAALIGFIRKSSSGDSSPGNLQPNQPFTPGQTENTQVNVEQPMSIDISHPKQADGKIFSSITYTVPNSLISVENKEEESGYRIKMEKNDFDIIFNHIIQGGEIGDELQGLITKSRLEDPEKYGNNKKCIIISALTLSLLGTYNRENLLTIIDFLEDKEPVVWERALIGIVLALSGREDLLDAQVKRKLNVLRNDEDIQECLTNLFYQLHFRNISGEELLYQNREGLTRINFFQKKSNWFLPFNHENIPEELIAKNNIYVLADRSIVLKDDNLKYLTFLQYGNLTPEDIADLEDSLQKENNLLDEFFAGNGKRKEHSSDRIIQNYLTIQFSYLYINHHDDWPGYNGNFEWSDELTELILNEHFQLKEKAIRADSRNDLVNTPLLYEEYLQQAGSSDPGAMKFYGYFKLYIKEFGKSLDLLLAAHDIDPVDVYLNSQIAFTYMALPEPDYSMALKYLLYAVTLDPLSVLCLKNIGFCYQKTVPPDYNQAMNYFLKAYTYDPEDFWLLSRIGSCYQFIDKPDFDKSREFLEKAIKVNTKDAATFGDLGYACQQSAIPDFQKSLEYHLDAYALDDSYVWNIKNIGYCYMNLPSPDYKKAIRYFMMAHDEDNMDRWTMLKIAYCSQLLSPPNYQAAIDFYLKIYDKNTPDVSLSKSIGICYMNLDIPDYLAAKGYLEEALAIDQGEPEIWSNLGYCYQFVDPQDFQKALDCHLKAYELDKNNLWNIKNIGHCYISIPSPDYQKALQFLEMANQPGNQDDWVFKKMGYCYQCLEKPDYAKALQYHLEAFGLNKTDAWNIQNVAFCYEKIDEPDHQKALEFYLKAYELDQEDAFTLTNVGLCYQEIDPPDFEKSLEFNLKAMKKDPDDFWNLQNVAYCYENLAKPDHVKALEFYLAASKKNPNDAITINNAALCYRNIEPPDFAHALELHLKAHELSPEDGLFMRDIAVCYQHIDLPDYASAIQYYYMAETKNIPPDGAYELSWGWCAMMLKKFDEAEFHLKRCLEITPEELEANMNLGHVAMLQNDPGKAREYYSLRLPASKTPEDFLDDCRKDFKQLESLGLDKDAFEKVIQEVIKV